jgi:Matrixin
MAQHADLARLTRSLTAMEFVVVHVKFSAVQPDGGDFLAGDPPFLVLPYEGIGLVFLDGVKSVDVRRDLHFDRSSLTVTPVRSSEIFANLMSYSQNFPQRLRDTVLALAGGIADRLFFGKTVLLSIEGSSYGVPASLDYVGKAGRAKMDLYTAKRGTASLSFRFIRYQDDSGNITAGTTLSPTYAGELIGILNRLYLPSANIELTLNTSTQVNVNRALGTPMSKASFLSHVAPLRDMGADITVFFVGQYKGTTDPLGEAFRDLKCAVVDDAPHQVLTLSLDDQINYGPNPLDRPRSDRDLHVVLAHEIAHLLGANHNDEPDNLMSMRLQTLRLNKDTVKAINRR